MITKKKLHEYLLYNHETGYFTWRWVEGRAIVKAGDIAGHINRKHGYWVIRVMGKEYPAHKLAWLYCYGDMPGNGEVRHINGDKYDNRLENLYREYR